MTESTMKGFEFVGSGDASDLLERPITKREVPIDRHISRICVEGYDTWLYGYDLELALRKHFSSCGEMLSIYVPRNFEKRILERCAFIRLAGEGTLEKALELSGSYVDVGGWQLYIMIYGPHYLVDYIKDDPEFERDLFEDKFIKMAAVAPVSVRVLHSEDSYAIVGDGGIYDPTLEELLTAKYFGYGHLLLICPETIDGVQCWECQDSFGPERGQWMTCLHPSSP